MLGSAVSQQISQPGTSAARPFLGPLLQLSQDRAPPWLRALCVVASLHSGLLGLVTGRPSGCRGLLRLLSPEAPTAAQELNQALAAAKEARGNR
jgi:hypothetical protein